MSAQGNIKVSVILSVFNRSKLFSRGLRSFLWQSFKPEEFEIVIVDDNSTEDISKVYSPYIGKLNIKHIIFDRKKHPIWQEMNTPDYKKKFNVPDNEEHFYHTPALSMNIGFHHAQADVICTSQPEIILSPDALKHGYNHVKFGGYQTYGELVMASERFNEWLSNNEKWCDTSELSYQELLNTVEKFGREHNFQPGEMYWMLAFYDKEKCRKINGVDLEYLRGVYAEDDNFKTRMRLTGTNEMYAGRTDSKTGVQGMVIGIHQSHKHEAKLYKKQDRDSSYWENAAQTNRKRWTEFCSNMGNGTPKDIRVANKNLSYEDIWGVNTIREIKEYYV